MNKTFPSPGVTVVEMDISYFSDEFMDRLWLDEMQSCELHEIMSMRDRIRETTK